MPGLTGTTHIHPKSMEDMGRLGRDHMRPPSWTDGRVSHEIARKPNGPMGVSSGGGVNIAWRRSGSPPEAKVRLFKPGGVPHP